MICDAKKGPAVMPQRTFEGRLRFVLLVLALAIGSGLGPVAQAQGPIEPHDDNLPAAKPEALQLLSDNRLRQHLMRNSQAPYRGACVCPSQAKDIRGHACNGHTVKRPGLKPALCVPSDVSDAMLADWRRHHR